MEDKKARLFEFAQKLHDLMREYDIEIRAYTEGEVWESYISGIYLLDTNDNELLLSSEDYVTCSDIAGVLKAKGEVMEGKEKMLEWLQREGFYSEGIGWCDENCVSLDDMWEKIDTIYFQMEVAELALSERDLYEFSLFCAEQIRHLMTDERSLQALDVRRKWLDGEASDKELNDAAFDASKVTFDVPGFAEEAIALSALCAVSSVWDVYGAATWAIKGAMFTGSDDVEEILFKKLKTFKPDWNTKQRGE